jgi:hypothetical protein
MYTAHGGQKKAGSIAERDAAVCSQARGSLCHMHVGRLLRSKTHRASRSALCLQRNKTLNATPKPDSVAAARRRSASHATVARPNRLPRPSSRPSMTWGCLKTSWPRLKGVCGVNTSCWAKSLGSCVPRCLAAVPTPNCAVCGAGTRIYPHACWVRCLNAPGSSGSGAWAWRCCYRYGAMPPARVRPHAVAGSGRGWAMTRSSKSMASSWASWAPGGAARNTGYSRALMGCCWSWSSARAVGGARGLCHSASRPSRPWSTVPRQTALGTEHARWTYGGILQTRRRVAPADGRRR